MRGSGFESQGAPASYTAKGGYKGGILLAWNYLASVRAFPPELLEAIRVSTEVLRFVPVLFRTKVTEIMVILTYPQDTVGPYAESNLQLWEEIDRLLHLTRLPAFIFGDLNAEPHELLDLPLVRRNGLIPILPDTAFTCTVGSQRLLDWGSASPSIAKLFSAKASQNAFTAHFAVTFEFNIQIPLDRILLPGFRRPRDLPSDLDEEKLKLARCNLHLFRDWAERILDMCRTNVYGTLGEVPKALGRHEPFLDSNNTKQFALQSLIYKLIVLFSSNVPIHKWPSFLGRGHMPIRIWTIPRHCSDHVFYYKSVDFWWSAVSALRSMQVCFNASKSSKHCEHVLRISRDTLFRVLAEFR